MVDWLNEFYKPEYKQLKDADTAFLIEYFRDNPPTTILDIGCGLAWESRAMQQKYNCELWLLEGNKTFDKSRGQVGWKGNSSNMEFYYSLSELDQNLQNLGTKNYHLMDANNIEIDSYVKFDLVYSAISCGFHYNANTYMDLIKKHSHADTKIIFDLRTKIKHQDNVIIKEVLVTGIKHKKCLIEFTD